MLSGHIINAGLNSVRKASGIGCAHYGRKIHCELDGKRILKRFR